MFSDFSLVFFFSFQYRFSIEEERKWNPHQQSGHTWPCSWARRLNATLGKSRLFWKSRRPDLCRFGQPQSAASIASFIPISCWVGLLFFLSLSFSSSFHLLPRVPVVCREPSRQINGGRESTGEIFLSPTSSSAPNILACLVGGCVLTLIIEPSFPIESDTSLFFFSSGDSFQTSKACRRPLELYFPSILIVAPVDKYSVKADRNLLVEKRADLTRFRSKGTGQS